MTRRFTSRVSFAALILCAAAALPGNVSAARDSRSVQRVHGTVLAVDTVAQSVTLQARPTDAMTTYHVENKKQLIHVKTGDQILGKIYEGETALRDVEIVGVAVRRPGGSGAGATGN